MPNRNLPVCFCSSGNIKNASSDLDRAGIDLTYFNSSFEMKAGSPKNFNLVLSYYGIRQNELLVIADNYDRDISPARELGCSFYHIPEYVDGKSNEIDINDLVSF